jgi:hypothetical protein
MSARSTRLRTATSPTVGDRGVWLAQFRNYGDTFGGPVVPPGPLDISIDGSTVTISWPGAGTLQRAATIGGAWDNVQATSPSRRRSQASIA